MARQGEMGADGVVDSPEFLVEYSSARVGRGEVESPLLQPWRRRGIVVLEKKLRVVIDQIGGYLVIRKWQPGQRIGYRRKPAETPRDLRRNGHDCGASAGRLLDPAPLVRAEQEELISLERPPQRRTEIVIPGRRAK